MLLQIVVIAAGILLAGLVALIVLGALSSYDKHH